MQNFLKILYKNRWLRSNFYSIIEDKEKNCILLRYDQKDDQDLADGKDFPLYDTNIQGEED